MHNQELSDQFDVLYNNISSNQAPGLDEYEKSVFLTKAEKQLVREYFDRSLDRTQQGFDGSIKRQYDFSTLIVDKELRSIAHHWNNEDPMGQDTFNFHGIPFIVPDDYYLPVNEIIRDNQDNIYSVIPLSYDEYQTVLKKPYQFPHKRQAWRIFTNQRGVNKGSTSLQYTGSTSEETTKIECSTSYASEGKSMTFSLFQDPSIADDIPKLRETFTEEDTPIIGDRVWRAWELFHQKVPNVDGYMSLKRIFNYHNLEYISASTWYINEGKSRGKTKLWDNDYDPNYYYDGINIDGETTNCIYQESGAIAITSVIVRGEASVLGLLKTYGHVVKDLEKEYFAKAGVDGVDKDPFTVIAYIKFRHWEEGKWKEGGWIVWNGGWEKPQLGVWSVPVELTSEWKGIAWKHNSDNGYKLLLLLNGPNGLFYDKKTINPDYKTYYRSLEGGVSLVGLYSIYSNFQLYRANSSDEIGSLIQDFKGKSYDYYISSPYDGDNPERMDMVNVTHWDFFDNFKWPQRIRFRDIERYTENDKCELFTVSLTPSSMPVAEILGKFKGGIKNYRMRYVRKPKPIILEDLEYGLSIDGHDKMMECELPEEMHEEILERAVLLAKIAWQGGSSSRTS